MNVAISGQFTVARPPAEAFELFTARGEERWVPGWRPRFPAAADVDDTAPGTVFETDMHGRTTTWVVVERGRFLSVRGKSFSSFSIARCSHPARVKPRSQAHKYASWLQDRPECCVANSCSIPQLQ